MDRLDRLEDCLDSKHEVIIEVNHASVDDDLWRFLQEVFHVLAVGERDLCLTDGNSRILRRLPGVGRCRNLTDDAIKAIIT